MLIEVANSYGLVDFQMGEVEIVFLGVAMMDMFYISLEMLDGFGMLRCIELQ